MGAFSEAVIDTDIMICLAKLDRMALLAGWYGLAFLTTEVNAREMRKPESKAKLVAAVAQGALTVVDLDNIEAIELFGQFRIQADAGESAVVAAAVVRGACAASHDAKAKVLAAIPKPPILVGSLEDIVADCVNAGRLAATDLQPMIDSLKQQQDYHLFAKGIPTPAQFQAWICPWT